MSDTVSKATVRQTIVSSIEAPKLCGLSTKHFIEFRKLRELYEKQIKEKNQEPGTRVPLVSYKSSIEDADLRIFVDARWVEASNVDAITEMQIRQCVADRCHRVLDGEHLYVIEEVVKKVSMKMQIYEAEDRVWTLHRDYLIVLRSAGYEELPYRKPHIAIQHLLKRLKPQQLQSRMKSIITWRKDEKFDKKDVSAFMREVAKQAKKLQEEKVFDSGHISSADEEEPKGLRKRLVSRSGFRPKGNRQYSNGYASTHARYRPHAHPHAHPPRAERNVFSTPPSGHNKRKRNEGADSLPACLNHKCKGRHFIQNCPNTDDATKLKLREEYRVAKKARTDRGRIASLIDRDERHHSALFSASFLQGNVTCEVLADQGADANLLPPAILNQLTKRSKVVVEALSPPRSYRAISGGICVCCEKEVVLDVQLKIRHGSNLTLRNVRW